MKAIRNLKLAIAASFLAVAALFSACEKDPVTDASAQNGGVGDAGTVSPQKTFTTSNTNTTTGTNGTPTSTSSTQTGTVNS